MPCVTLALPSSLFWVGAAAGRKEGFEGSPFSPSWLRLYLLCHQGTVEIQVPNVKLVPSGGAVWTEKHAGRDCARVSLPGGRKGRCGAELCTRPLFQRGQISWSAARESKLPNFPLHGPSHLTDSSAERFNDFLLVPGETFFF